MEDLKIERYFQQRAAFEDRAISGLQDGYTLEQLQKINDAVKNAVLAELAKGYGAKDVALEPVD
jgi:hypothetical protein